MGFLLLSLYQHNSGATLTPADSIRRLEQAFPEAVLLPGDQLTIRAENARTQFADELRTNPEGPARIVVETLRRNAREYGPAYAFEFPLEHETKLRGHVRRYDITFLFNKPISEDMRQRIIAFLKSFNAGKIETVTAEKRQPEVLCDMPGPAAFPAGMQQDLPTFHSDNPSPGAA